MPILNSGALNFVNVDKGLYADGEGETICLLINEDSSLAPILYAASFLLSINEVL